MEKVETTILKNLIFSDEYSRKVLPFIEKEYFESYHEKVIFEEIAKFIIEYNNLPTKEVLIIESEKRTDISDDGFKDICDEVGAYETYQLIYNGYLTPQRNGVKIVLSILH